MTVLDGIRPVPGAWLDSLAVEMKLSPVEWRITALVMAHGPITVYDLAQRLGLSYALAKRAARGLARWSILTRSPEGLIFQPESKGWQFRGKGGPARTPSTTREPSRPPAP